MPVGQQKGRKENLDTPVLAPLGAEVRSDLENGLALLRSGLTVTPRGD